MNALALTSWDWFVIGAVLISCGLGMISGMVRTIFALAAWVLAFLAAPMLAPTVLVATGVSMPPLLAMALVFVLTLIAVRLLGGVLANLIGRVGLGGLDRSLGVLLGLARALVIIMIAAVIGRTMLGADKTPQWREALSRPLLEYLVAFADPVLPEQSRSVRRT